MCKDYTSIFWVLNKVKIKSPLCYHVQIQFILDVEEIEKTDLVI